MGLATLLFNADVVCMDPARTTASALCYRNGTILYVGGEADARRWLGQHNINYNAVDCSGACILPGFIDAHLHPMLMAIYQHNVDLAGITHMDELRQLIQQQAATTAENEWILALQLEEQNLDISCLPNRYQLDEICRHRPLVIFKRDGHSICVNSEALRLSGLSKGHAAVAGGTIEYDDAEVPNGIFKENAVSLVMQHYVGPGIEQLMQSSQLAFAKLSQQGITSIGAILQTDATGPSGASGSHEYIAMAALAPHSPFSIYGILIGEQAASQAQLKSSALNNPDSGHKIGAFKIFADGTLGSCTACMHQGFFDQPEKQGYLTFSEDTLYQRMRQAHLAGWQICIHAIGDKAVATCVQLYSRLLQQYPKADHRHRIEHASVIDAESLLAIAELKLVLCCQPLFIRSEKHWLSQRLGPARAALAYPFKSIQEAGIYLVGSSDAPIENTSVLAAVEVAVTRDDFHIEQGLTVDQALAMYTCNAAFAQFEEQQKGSLQIGKKADLVMLDKNPHYVAAEKISQIKILQTIYAGKQTFSCADEVVA